jgi:hypothetical protein
MTEDEALAYMLKASLESHQAALPPSEVPGKRPRSDSEVAREIHERETGATTGPSVIAGAAGASLAGDSSDVGGGDGATPLGPSNSLQEDIRNLYGEQKMLRQFDLFHVNGLEDAGGRLAKCVAVHVRQTESGLVTELATADVANGSDARAFEGVLRTKWPGAMVSYPDAIAPKLN